MNSDFSGMSFDLGTNSCGDIKWNQLTKNDLANMNTDNYIDICNLFEEYLRKSNNWQKKPKAEEVRLFSVCIGKIVNKLQDYFIIINLFKDKKYEIGLIDNPNVYFSSRFRTNYLVHAKLYEVKCCAWIHEIELLNSMLLLFSQSGRPSIPYYQSQWNEGFGIPFIVPLTVQRKKRLRNVVVTEVEARSNYMANTEEYPPFKKKRLLKSKANAVTIVPLKSDQIEMVDPDYNARVILEGEGDIDLIRVTDHNLIIALEWLQEQTSKLDPNSKFCVFGAFASELCQRLDWYRAPPTATINSDLIKINHDDVALDVDQVALNMTSTTLSSKLSEHTTLDNMFAHYFKVLESMEFKTGSQHSINNEQYNQGVFVSKGGSTYDSSEARKCYTCFFNSKTFVFKASIKFSNSKSSMSSTMNKATDATFNGIQAAIIDASTYKQKTPRQRIFIAMELAAEWICCKSAPHLQNIDYSANYFAKPSCNKTLTFVCGEFTYTMLVIFALTYIEQVVTSSRNQIVFCLETYGTKASFVQVLPKFSYDHINYDKCSAEYWAKHEEKSLPSASIVKWSIYCRQQYGMVDVKENKLTIGAGITTRVSMQDSSTGDKGPLYTIIAPNCSPFKLGNEIPTFHEFKEISENCSNYDFYSIYGTILPHEMQPFTDKRTKPVDGIYTIVRVQSYNHSARNALGEHNVKIKQTELVADPNNLLREIAGSDAYSFDCKVAEGHLRQFKELLDQHLQSLRVSGNIARCEVAAIIYSKTPEDFVTDLGGLFQALCCTLQTKTKYYDARKWSTIISFFANGIIFRYCMVLQSLSNSPEKIASLWPIISESHNLIRTFYSGVSSFAKHGVVGKKLTYLLRRLCVHSLPTCCHQVSSGIKTFIEIVFPKFCDRLGLPRKPKFLISKFPIMKINMPYVPAMACGRCFCVYWVPAKSAETKSHHKNHPCLTETELSVKFKEKLSTAELVGINSNLFSEYLAEEKRKLDLHQKDFLSRMLDETDPRPIFLSGAAGSGKSTVLKLGVKCLLAREGLYRVGALALTKSAAVNIGGVTIHSYFALEYETSLTNDGFTAKLITDKLEAHASKYKSANTKWNNPSHQQSENDEKKLKINIIRNYLKYLIIDECSMLTGYALDVIDSYLRQAKDNPSVPFGGVKLILCGDPMQSLPFVKHKETNNTKTKAALRFFQSNVWYNTSYPFTVVHLPAVHRQEKGDFQDILNRIRIGEVSQADVDYLNLKSGSMVPISFVLDIVATALDEAVTAQIDGKLYSRATNHGLSRERLALGTSKGSEGRTQRVRETRMENLLSFHNLSFRGDGEDCETDFGKCYSIVCEHIESDFISKKVQAHLRETDQNLVPCHLRVCNNQTPLLECYLSQLSQSQMQTCIENARYEKIETELFLRVGQIVVFTDNTTSPFIANGSFGVIECFNYDFNYEKVISLMIKPIWHDPRYELPSLTLERKCTSFGNTILKQFPIKPALACTIAIAQGKTMHGIPTVILNERIMQANTVYTAASRFCSSAYFCFLHPLTVEEVNSNVDQTAKKFLLHHTNNLTVVVSKVDYTTDRFSPLNNN